MSNRKAFLTIEVLISIVIIFLAIITLTSSLKIVSLFSHKASTYEVNYITLHSILNTLQNIPLEQFNLSHTKYTPIPLSIKNINGYNVNILAKKVQEDYSQEYNEFGQTIQGQFKVSLFSVQIKMQKGQQNIQYNTYFTKVSK
jgi:hypothetical protein